MSLLFALRIYTIIMSGLQNMFDLRDESQAKEYLDTLGVEYRFQCYKEEKPDGCHRLADFFEAFRQDIPKAKTVYKHNCEQNNFGHSCFKMGNYSMIGKGGPVDMESAVKYYEKGCSAGYMQSCHNIALMYHLGKTDSKRDYVKSKGYLEKGCAGSNTQSCQLLSTYFITGKEGVPKDMKQAFKYAEKACGMGHMYACANLSQMYRKGEGVEKNEELAKKLKTRAQMLHKDVTEMERTMTFGN